MFSGDRSQLRKMFFSAWKKHQSAVVLESLEEIIVQTIQQHPEYFQLFDNEQLNIDKDYLPENGDSNPYLHLAMHISIHEQLSTQRPAQITQLYQQLLIKLQDPHKVEHCMMDCLGEMIWQAQRENKQADESSYIACLENLLEAK